jgi:SNF2 family DNA or RNA helicase
MLTKVVAVAFNPIEFGLKPEISLFTYQVDGIRRLIAGTSILCDEMGLGKTIQMIGVLHHLNSGGHNLDGHPNLIVVPTGELAKQWKSELLSKSILFSQDYIIVVTTPEEFSLLAKFDSENPLFLAGKVIITTYECVKKNNSQKRLARYHFQQESIGEIDEKGAKRLASDTFSESGHQKKKKALDGFLKTPGWFGSKYWKLLICDEIHKMGSVMSYNFDGLDAVQSFRRFALTGTPIVDTMHEIVATIAVTDPEFDWKDLRENLIHVASSLGHFLTYLKSAYHFTVTLFPSGEGAFNQFLESNFDDISKALDKIKMVITLMSSRYIIRNFDLVKPDFLEFSDLLLRRDYSVIHEMLVIDPSRELAASIETANRGFQEDWYCRQGSSTIFHTTGKRVAAHSEGYRQKHQDEGTDKATKAMIYGESREALYGHKLAKVKTLLPQLHEPIVIAVDVKREISALSRELASEYCVFTKDTLEAYKAACSSDYDRPPILIILQSTTGLNITEAKHMIIFDQPKSQADLDQVMARINRIGQTSDISFYHFKAETKIDQLYEDICRLQKEAMAILVNPKSFLKELGGDTESDPSEHSQKIAIFFMAKAIHELIHRNVIMSEFDPESYIFQNMQRIQQLEFKGIFQLFVKKLSQKMAESGASTSEFDFSGFDLGIDWSAFSPADTDFFGAMNLTPDSYLEF